MQFTLCMGSVLFSNYGEQIDLKWNSVLECLKGVEYNVFQDQQQKIKIYSQLKL